MSAFELPWTANTFPDGELYLLLELEDFVACLTLEVFVRLHRTHLSKLADLDSRNISILPL